MSYPYPNVPQPMNPGMPSKDESDLNTLAILHYVWSGFLGCSTFGLIGYFVMIGALIANAPSGPHPPDPHAQQAAAGIMIAVAVVMGIMMIALLVLHLLAAAGLKKRTRYTLAFAMACMACLSVPLGTALGVWTIMVLTRPSVKALFGRA